MKKLIILLALLPVLSYGQVDFQAIKTAYDNSQAGQQFNANLEQFKTVTYNEILAAAGDGDIEHMVGIPQEFQEMDLQDWMAMFSPLTVELLYIAGQPKLRFSGWRD